MSIHGRAAGRLTGKLTTLDEKPSRRARCEGARALRERKEQVLRFVAHANLVQKGHESMRRSVRGLVQMNPSWSKAGFG